MDRSYLEQNNFIIKNRFFLEFEKTNSDELDRPNFQDKKNGEMVYWGEFNRLPNDAIKLKEQNGVLVGMQDFKFRLVKGGDLYIYKKEIVENKEIRTSVVDSQIQDWIEESEIELSYLVAAARELAEFENFFCEFIFSKDNSQINTLKVLPCVKTRTSEYKDKFFVGNWELNKLEETIPLIDLNQRQAKAAKQYSVGSTSSLYYPTPAWYAAKNWILLSTKIPLIKLRSMDNSMQIRYHIKMPADYIRNMYEGKMNPTTEMTYTPAEIAEIQKDFKKSVIEFLTGIENTDKAIFTETKFTYDGKKVEFEIIPLEDKKQYDAFLDDFQNSHDVMTSTAGVDESLAAISTGRISSSGSDKRNSWNIQVARYNLERQLMLSPINHIVKRKNGWNKEHFVGIQTMELTTTDLVKSGQVENN